MTLRKKVEKDDRCDRCWWIQYTDPASGKQLHLVKHEGLAQDESCEPGDCICGIPFDHSPRYFVADIENGAWTQIESIKAGLLSWSERYGISLTDDDRNFAAVHDIIGWESFVP